MSKLFPNDVWSEAVRWTIVPNVGDDGNQEFDEPLDFWDHFDIAMVRSRAEFVDASTRSGPRLHLGCGRKLIEPDDPAEDSPWINIDYPEWDAEAFRNPESKRARLPFDDESVAEIACYHTLDHLTPEAVVNALREFQRVLQPGAPATIVVPHFMGTLWNECLFHKSRFAVDTWRNIFSERQYDHTANERSRGTIPEPWKLDVGFNMIMGLNERNLVLVTQLVRR